MRLRSESIAQILESNRDAESVDAFTKVGAGGYILASTEEVGRFLVALVIFIGSVAAMSDTILEKVCTIGIEIYALGDLFVL
jgi:hypothetical protein